MEKILVLGSNGQLGKELRNLSSSYSEISFFFRSKEELSITDFEKINTFINANNISVIINCAAYTNVDKAETEIKLAEKLNYKSVKNLALIAEEKKIKLIHISTDYVFDGQNNSSYLESDKTNPINIYGRTKLAGENAIIKINPKNSIIIRTSWVYSKYGKNFVKTMLRLAEEKKELKVISDQYGSPTYAKDLARLILDILPKIKNDKAEIYHYSNEGVISWFDFADAIFKISGKRIEVKAILSSEFATLAKRPKNSILNKQKIKKTFSVEIPFWKDSLKECLKELI